MPKRTYNSSTEDLEKAAEAVRKGVSHAKAARKSGVKKSMRLNNQMKKIPPQAIGRLTESSANEENEPSNGSEAVVHPINSRTTSRRSCNSCSMDDLEKAVEAVGKGMSYDKAAKKFGVKRSTLFDKMTNIHPNAVGRPTESSANDENGPSNRLVVVEHHNSCSTEDLEKAMEAVRKGVTYAEAAQKYIVGKSTLSDKTKKIPPKMIIRLTESSANEENGSPNVSEATAHPLASCTPSKRSYNSCTQDDLEKAVEAVGKGMSYAKAAKKFGVKRSTLFDKMKKSHPKAVGRPTELSDKEERRLSNGLAVVAHRGIPLGSDDISEIVKRCLDRRNIKTTAFKDNRPGKTWVANFRKRQQLSERVSKRTRTAVGEIADHLKELSNMVQELPPSDIVDFDEPDLQDVLEGTLALVPAGIYIDVPKIEYKPDATAEDIFCFKHYNPSETIMGRKMQDWLRFSVCFWHTFRGTGADPFGFPTLVRSWDDGSDSIENAKRRLKVAFDFLDRLGIKYWSFHDRDIAPEGETLAETNANLDTVVDYAMELMKEKGIKLLWNTCNLFAHPRYMNGAATNPDAHVLAYAGAQVKKSLEIAQKMGAENFVFWGGREGYHTLLNTDVRAELDQMANFFKMVVAYKEKIGFTGQLLIEPKPKEPAKHQYDYDAMTVIAFLKTYDLDKHFKLNIEPNHTTLAGHCYEHDIVMASAYGMLGSVDSNTGSPDLGWDTDQFPMDVKSATLVMKTILQQGGLSPGGLNFDCKVRRESTDLEDMLIAHIGAMDCFARGLRNAVKIIEDGIMDRAIKDRYSTFSSGFGAKVKAGTASLEECNEYIAKNGNPVPKSGKQEKMELILNRYV